MSSIKELLQEAATEVREEERELAAEAIQIAADEAVAEAVAMTTGTSDKISALEDSVASLAAKNIAEKNIDVKEDVQALLDQMDVKPKYDPMDDVEALLQMSKEEQKVSSPSAMDAYRQRRAKQSKSAKSVSSTTRTWSSYHSEPSRVAVLLHSADEKPWGQDIRYKFASPQQEMMFRNMKVVRPASRSQRQNMSLSTRDRLEQHSTHNSLDVHAVKQSQQAAALKQKRRQDIRGSTERMCESYLRKPSKADMKLDPSLRYSRFDDAKECSFRPRINGRDNNKRTSRNNRDDDDDDERHREDRKFAFINRQEAEERNRRDELEFRVGKANYDARVNKKMCPQCGSKQSYDEFKEKRKLCVNCGIEYSSQVSWSKVGKRFFRKNLEYAQKVAEKKSRLRQELEDEFKYIQRTKIDPHTGKSVTYKDYNKQVLTPREELEFFDRIDTMLERRENRVKNLEEKIYKEKYPFKPNISDFAKMRADNKDDDMNDDSDLEPAEAFLKRYNEDLDQRREKFPTKYLRSRWRSEEEDAEPFRVSTRNTYGGAM